MIMAAEQSSTSASEPLPSALTQLIADNPRINSCHTKYYHTLALQVLHSLRHQHYWSNLYLHTESPISGEPLPRPIISGLPPARIYVHPDDQVDEVKAGIKEAEAERDQEWVLPTRLREKWSLRRFANVFDAIDEVPSGGMKIREEGIVPDLGTPVHNVQEFAQTKSGKRRGGKRLLLATVGDDSTIVYYIVHDGIVKPRQN